MSLYNIILILFWGLLIPFILGYQFDIFYSKDKISYARCLLFGYVVYCATFQLIAPEFIILGGSFSSLFYSWLAIIGILVVPILVLNRENFISRVNEPINSIFKDAKASNKSVIRYIIDKFDWLEWLVFAGAVFFVAFHTLLIGCMMHFDTDDARFVAEALEAYEKNTLLAYHPITGDFIGAPVGEMLKDVFAPYPVFMAIYGKLFGLTPAVATHTVLPFLYVPMCYMAFYLVAKNVFKDDRRSVIISVFLFAVINTFSMETIFSFGWVLLTLVWQGRSFLCTVMIPFMLYILMQFITDEKVEFGRYIILATSGVACCMLSGMGAMLMVLMMASFIFVTLITRKDIKVATSMLLAMMPTVIYFVLYSTYSGKL